MKVLVLGASGLVGANLLTEARARGHEVTGTFRHHPLPGLIALDLRQQDHLRDLLAQCQPEAVFYCGGWSWVDGCEGDPRRAHEENVVQPSWAAAQARTIGAHFTYFSTSYVFDGNSGPYDETVPPCPISAYGHSKRAGEEAVLEAAQGRAVVARTMGVYGPEPQRKNFVDQVRRALAAGQRIQVPNDQFGNITYAPVLAQMALELAERRLTGIWNLAGADPNLRRSDFARQIAHAYGLPADLVEPVETAVLRQAAPRPRQGGLITEKIRQVAAFASPDWVRFE